MVPFLFPIPESKHTLYESQEENIYEYKRQNCEITGTGRKSE